MKKKLMLLFISAVLVLSVSACGGDKDADTASSKSLIPDGVGTKISGNYEEPEDLDEEEAEDLDDWEEPEDLDEEEEIEELPEEFEPAGEGPEDAEWNK